jgi:hypothetical protein
MEGGFRKLIEWKHLSYDEDEDEDEDDNLNLRVGGVQLRPGLPAAAAENPLQETRDLQVTNGSLEQYDGELFYARECACWTGWTPPVPTVYCPFAIDKDPIHLKP